MHQSTENICFHCGNEIEKGIEITSHEHQFCCLGCKTIFEIFSENKLDYYYKLEKNPGVRPEETGEKYAFLSNEKIVENLLEFNDANKQIVRFYIPNIHCSSCIWVLENLHKLNRNVIQSLVDFPKKTARITYHSDKISLKELAELLAYIGYPPYISLDDYQKQGTNKQNKTLLYKLGIAGFAFGNVMLLSLPGFFETDEYWVNRYEPFFRWLSFAFSLPVMFYSASDYFISAYKGLRSRILSIDVPLALGILAMFVRSLYDIIFDHGQGFLDSLNGLVFFLLIGKFFQQKTYSFLSFERDYKSYFPIGITKISPDGKEESIQIYDIKQGDRLLIRNEELIPADAILLKGKAHIDYSFVTGESELVHKNSGDKLFAGGKQKGDAIEVETIKTISQSYLTQLWSNDIFQKDKFEGVKFLTDKISKYFTIILLAISVLAFAYWFWAEGIKEAFNVFTAILIIACPCALAMSAPFTLGNVLRIFGRNKLYLKDTKVIEQMAKINQVIFDKTGTITSNRSKISYQGSDLSSEEKILLKNAIRNSNHPLSRQIYNLLPDEKIISLDTFNEVSGKGIIAEYQQQTIRIGSADFVGKKSSESNLQTSVYVSVNEEVKGEFLFQNSYREGMQNLFNSLGEKYTLAVLSGDNSSEEETLTKMLPSGTKLHFNQKPNDKLKAIHSLQEKGKNVLMLGDGLNDAGALKQSDVGISVAENVNVFSPACDGIMDASVLKKLDVFLHLSKKAIQIIKISFILSLLYNVVGLSFAVTGQLSPLIAAVLMPLSSISIVLFTTFMASFVCKKLKN